jgi:hypothetical protein
MAANLIKRIKGLAGLVIIFGIVVSFARCGDDEPFASQLITFIIPTTIEPKDSLITIGDTLWISVNVSDSLYDYHTKKRYKFPGLSFGQTSIVFNKLVDNTQNLSFQSSAAQFFHFIDPHNQIDFLGDRFVDVVFRYDAQLETYNLLIGIIPQHVGVYCLWFLSASDLRYAGVVDLGKSSNGARIIPVYNYIYFPINEGENNYELFKKHCLPTYAGPEDFFVDYYSEYLGTFTFRVME